MMKRSTIAYMFLLAGLMAACNGSEKKEAPAQDSAGMATQPAEQVPESDALAGKLPDPVCGMPYDTTYHELSVYKKDTVYFCSPTCKRVFDKNPEKYAKVLGL